MPIQAAALRGLLGNHLALGCLPHPAYTFMSARVPREQARRALDLPLEGRIWLFFGLVRAYKGLNLLLDALGELQNTACAPFLWVAGEFWQDIQRYQLQVQRLGLAGRVRLADGYVCNESLPTLFSAVDGLVAPYLQGTQSGVVALAQGFGLPVLATSFAAGNAAPTPYLRLIPAGDRQALAAGLCAELPAPNPVSGTQDWLALAAALTRVGEAIP